MSVFRWFALTLSLAAVASLPPAWGDDKPAPKAKPTDPAVITELGSRTLFDGQLIVRVTADSAEKKPRALYFSITPKVKGFESLSYLTTGQQRKAKDWFVVAESATRVWVYKPLFDFGVLEVVDFKDEKGSFRGLRAGEKKTAEVLGTAPKAVLDRLPAEFKAPPKGK